MMKEVKGEIPKILNKNEFIKRISSVLGSNDPIARGITLKVLAIMSPIIIEKIELHIK